MLPSTSITSRYSYPCVIVSDPNSNLATILVILIIKIIPWVPFPFSNLTCSFPPDSPLSNRAKSTTTMIFLFIYFVLMKELRNNSISYQLFRHQTTFQFENSEFRKYIRKNEKKKKSPLHSKLLSLAFCTIGEMQKPHVQINLQWILPLTKKLISTE